ncbi:hypothetical protein [Paenibacillus sp. GCM10023252]|uniref:hypothetical protein n=1 Tax=Paenibacillus sp. GCM10023252 TaxID=3252649 RepID=UPI0036D43889
MKSIVHALLFSLVIHLLVIGVGYTYLEYQRRGKFEQGFYASEYGLQAAGGSLTVTLIITFVALATLYLVGRWIIKLINFIK